MMAEEVVLQFLDKDGKKVKVDEDNPLPVDGIKGPSGNAATMEIESTETVGSSKDAEVSNEGTKNKAKLKFKIPKGKSGGKGDTGPAPSFEIDSVETVGPDEDAEVENVGDNENIKLKFKIPRGKDGKDAEED